MALRHLPDGRGDADAYALQEQPTAGASLPQGGKSAKIHASLGFIWGIRFRIMFISYTDVGDNLRKIVILGRLDIPGTESVAGELEKLAAAPKKGVVVDVSSLKFLASLGIRALLKSAKAVEERGGRMVLVVGTNSQVVMSLEATGVSDLLPMFKSNGEAERAAVA
jgi:anti-anti-sigma factor